MGRIGDTAAAKGRRFALAGRLGALGDRSWDGGTFLELRPAGSSALASMNEIPAENRASQVDSSPQQCRLLPKRLPTLVQVTVCGVYADAERRLAIVVSWARSASTPNG